MNIETVKLECDLMLEAIVGGIDIQTQWWNSPNKAFDLKTPKDELNDEPGNVYVYLLNQLQR
jgi:hypothetical protein